MIETHLSLFRQTAKLGLIKTVHDLFPDDSLRIVYSIRNGVFCKLADSLLSEREVKLINLRLGEWVKRNNPVVLKGKSNGYYHYDVDGFIIKTSYPAGCLPAETAPFVVVPFLGGLIINFVTDADVQKELILPQKLATTYFKSRWWLSNLGISVVDDINKYIKDGHGTELIGIAEALQEKEISDIADSILAQKRAVRIVLISGPSSSGKTTFARRLSTQLRVNGMRPFPLSLDDYFVNRPDTPLDIDGNYNFESPYALDLPLIQQHIAQLINGETINIPSFDFVTGMRGTETKPMKLGASDIVVIEGIHALNPILLPNITRNIAFRIYVSALFNLNIDSLNRIPTTEVRMIRRLVRDEQFRGITPEETFARWTSVRRGEDANIFPYQEECDVMFNSSLMYEMNALRYFAEKAFAKIPPNSPHRLAQERLLNLLSFFEPMETDKVPFNSILKEFIGGSVYF